MAKAINCDDKCSSYEYCESEGVTEMFMRGSTCGDRCEEETHQGE